MCHYVCHRILLSSIDRVNAKNNWGKKTYKLRERKWQCTDSLGSWLEQNKLQGNKAEFSTRHFMFMLASFQSSANNTDFLIFRLLSDPFSWLRAGLLNLEANEYTLSC